MTDICLNCFRNKGDYEVCPYCGFMEGTPPAQAYHLHPGEVLGDRYTVGTVLGYGGFGVTYKAWDATLSSIVAIKEFYPADLVSRIPGQKRVVVFSGERAESYRAQLTRFIDEARNMARFNNDPHIVGVYDFFAENGTAYIVMEFLDGQTLKMHMAERGGKLPEEEAMRYAAPLLEAVKSIHDKKIIHRDISPDNIFILRDGRLKVLDFGAARFSETPSEFTTAVVIKPGYAPPEQYRSKMKQGSWTDLYAVGATLYKMLTGVTPEESIDRMEKDLLEPPSKLVALENTALDTIILRAMALEPDVRIQKASDFLDALEGRSELELPEVELKKQKTRRTLSIVAGVAVALALIIVAAMTTPKSSPVSIIDLNAAPDTITIEVLDEEIEIYEPIVEQYMIEFPDQKVEIVTSDGDLYRTDESTDWAGETELTDLYNAINPADYLFVEEFWENEKTILPVTFYAPVCFVNTTLAEAPYTSDNLPQEYDMSYNSAVWSQFQNEEIPYMIANTTWLREVQMALPGYYSVIPYGDVYQLGGFYYWSVSADADANEQLAAQQFLGYLLGEYAQNVLCMQNYSSLPINRKVFEQYLNINTDLSFLRDEIS